MRFYLVLAVLSATFSSSALAQSPTTATADDGRKVLLYPDGTWKPVQTNTAAGNSSTALTKPADATLYVKAPAGAFGIWINPDKWKQDAVADGSDPSKITFHEIKPDGYAMVIAEGIAIPLESLKTLAMNNAKSAAPDAHIIMEEKRVVNGKEIMCLEIEGTIQGISFTYYGYYYGGPEGALQVITYTGTNLFNGFKPDFDDFLNGTQIGQ
jgi:hypothetical protein